MDERLVSLGFKVVIAAILETDPNVARVRKTLTNTRGDH